MIRDDVAQILHFALQALNRVVKTNPGITYNKMTLLHPHFTSLLSELNNFIFLN